MTRIEKICSYLDACNTFADVGCDHGFCTLNMLKSGKCKSATVTDVSAKSLKKAETLLSEYVISGRVKPVCCDGLALVPEDIEQVLIAGMGGMEIIKILKEGFIPSKFVLQPMKNAEKLRSYLIESGCKITADDLFFDGNYYFVIKGEREGGTSGYTPLMLRFGRDSLRNPVFKEYAECELGKKLSYLSGVEEGSDAENMKREIVLLKEALEWSR